MCNFKRSNNKFLGLISENDILLLAEQGKFEKNLIAKDLVKDGYDITAKMDSSIASVVKKMYKSEFKHVLIQGDESEVQGIVSVRDFVYHLIEYFPETVYNVLPGKKMSTEDREGA